MWASNASTQLSRSSLLRPRRYQTQSPTLTSNRQSSYWKTCTNVEWNRNRNEVLSRVVWIGSVTYLDRGFLYRNGTSTSNVGFVLRLVVRQSSVSKHHKALLPAVNEVGPFAQCAFELSIDRVECGHWGHTVGGHSDRGECAVRKVARYVRIVRLFVFRVRHAFLVDDHCGAVQKLFCPDANVDRLHCVHRATCWFQQRIKTRST